MKKKFYLVTSICGSPDPPYDFIPLLFFMSIINFSFWNCKPLYIIFFAYFAEITVQ